MIGIPNIDGNTIALVKFGRYGILDYCSKVMWTHHGNEPTIVYDSQMGNAMLSKNCYYTSSDYAFGTNTTLEAWCWIQNNSSDRCALAQIKVTKVTLGEIIDDDQHAPVGNMISTFRISNYARWTSNFTPPQCV